tara:strand:- start:1310 stop:1795 length:486 start_codon:yes stop_codon:yes gene_type:complete
MNKIHIKYSFILIIILTLASCSSGEEQVPGDSTSSTIWTGNNITFSKADGADYSQASNQDRLTSNVSITRANDGGQIFNIVKESAANKNSSPAGTTWSIGSIDNINSLSFTNFRAAVGKPKDVVGKNLVMHLVDDNIYLSVKFTSWSDGQKGGFAYERSTP